MKAGQMILPQGSIKLLIPELSSFSLQAAGKLSVRGRLFAGRTVRQSAVEIPDGSIYVDAPDLAQPNNYSCALAAASVARFYGVGPSSLSEFMEGMKTKRSGTFATDIADYLNKLGLDASVCEDMSKEDLMDLLDQEIATVLAIQAYAEDTREYDDADNHRNGHYVAAIGYSQVAPRIVDRRGRPGKRTARKDLYFYFMDPSILCRYGYLAWRDLDRRWHDDDGSRAKPKVSRHLGIVIRPNGHEPVHATVAERIE